MTDRPRVDVALEGDQLLQKFVASASKHNAEVEFLTLDLDYVGFITGLDEDWVKITLTGPAHKGNGRLRSTLLRLGNVTVISETGRKLTDLSTEEAEQVRTYTNLFRKISQAESRSA